ncbi:MAG: hypothetical protein ACFCUU_14610 [Cyclobacteriaceae bacterium]
MTLLRTIFLLWLALALSRCESQVQLSETNTWYVFEPENNHTVPSLIGLEDWNNEPAGKHGIIEDREDKLYYNDKEIKIWGINNCYGACTPDKEMAEKRAAFYRKFGINGMRLHKYADRPRMGIQSEESFTEFNPEALDRMDYYVHTLAENGIYTKLSPSFGVKFGPGDVHRIPFHQELGDVFAEDNKRIRANYGLVYMSKELQDMQIEQTLKILNHTNPYTGKRYADDPAIFCVEMFNEDAVLWFGGNWSLQRVPTIMKRMGEQFSQWLMQKYGSESAWKAAWGDEAILSDLSALQNSNLHRIIEPDKVKGKLKAESLQANTVLPWGNASIYDNIANPDGDYPELKNRVLDAAEFLIGLQNAFYGRFAEAIRETGFKGQLVSSNWQAGSTIGHLLNLHSDQSIGIVDRHNYFGGAKKGLKEGVEFASGTSLAQLGVGTLSAGWQQVEGRPFMLSEWIHVQPNEYYAEGPAVLGAYGWGLNGWDVSYIFQNSDNGAYSERLGKSNWDVANPAIIATFPAIARQVRRMDVNESTETHYLNVHVPSLLEGKLSFIGSTDQQHDSKIFTTDKVPSYALAAKRVAVRFLSEFTETPAFEKEPFIIDSAMVAETKQLSWTPAEDGQTKGGYFIMNTAATKAFVGFAPGNRTFDLGDGYEITPEKGFAVVYLTAKNIDEDLKSSEEIVVTAISRVRNTGMELNEEENKILKVGEAPLLMEPVKAVVSVPFSGELLMLDHDGKAIKSEARKFRKNFGIDGAVDQTPFYLIRK